MVEREKINIKKLEKQQHKDFKDFLKTLNDTTQTKSFKKWFDNYHKYLVKAYIK